MGKLEVITHPLIQHKLSILRRTDTSTKAQFFVQGLGWSMVS